MSAGPRWTTGSSSPNSELVETAIRVYLEQVFSETDTNTQFHQILKQFYHPAWPMLHKVGMSHRNYVCSIYDIKISSRILLDNHNGIIFLVQRGGLAGPSQKDTTRVTVFRVCHQCQATPKRTISQVIVPIVMELLEFRIGWTSYQGILGISQRNYVYSMHDNWFSEEGRPDQDEQLGPPLSLPRSIDSFIYGVNEQLDRKIPLDIIIVTKRRTSK